MDETKLSLVEEWWMDDQKELVEDNSRNWVKQPFKTVVGYWVLIDGHKLMGKVVDQLELPPNAIIDDTGWDHEHCRLCWETISEHINYEHEGYTDGKEWLCVKCYEKYITPRVKQ
jgi:hypothetical protein